MLQWEATDSHLNDLVGVVLAIGAVPVVVRDGVEGGLEAPQVGDVLALLAEQQLVLVVLAAADGAAALLALLVLVVLALLANLLRLLLLLHLFGEFRAKLSKLVQVLGGIVVGRGVGRAGRRFGIVCGDEKKWNATILIRRLI